MVNDTQPKTNPVPPIDNSLEGAPNYDGTVVTQPQNDNPQTQQKNSGVTPVVDKSSTTPSTSTTPSGGFNGYDVLIPWLEQKIKENQPLSDEEKRKLRRRQRAEGIISGISDAVQSVANLWFTHNYAPNMYNAKEGMSAKARERFDKAKAERDAQDDRFFNYALTLGKLKTDAARDERNWNHTIEREKITDQYKDKAEARAQAKAERDANMATLRMELMDGKIDQQEAAARAEKIEADYAEAYWKSRIDKNNYRAPKGAVADVPYTGPDGKTHFTTSASKQKAISQYYDTWEETSDTSTTQKTESKGHKTITTTTQTTKPGKGKPKNSAKSKFSIHK